MLERASENTGAFPYYARIENVGKYHSRMVSKLPIISKRTRKPHTTDHHMEMLLLVAAVYRMLQSCQ